MALWRANRRAQEVAQRPRLPPTNYRTGHAAGGLPLWKGGRIEGRELRNVLPFAVYRAHAKVATMNLPISRPNVPSHKGNSQLERQRSSSRAEQMPPTDWRDCEMAEPRRRTEWCDRPEYLGDDVRNSTVRRDRHAENHISPCAELIGSVDGGQNALKDFLTTRAQTVPTI